MVTSSVKKHIYTIYHVQISTIQVWNSREHAPSVPLLLLCRALRHPGHSQVRLSLCPETRPIWPRNVILMVRVNCLGVLGVMGKRIEGKITVRTLNIIGFNVSMHFPASNVGLSDTRKWDGLLIQRPAFVLPTPLVVDSSLQYKTCPCFRCTPAWQRKMVHLQMGFPLE